MRMFAAILPPPEAAEELAGVVARELAGLPGGGRLRWTERDGWHITLAYYGETDEDQAARLRGHLAGVASRRAPFALRLAGGESLGGWAVGAGVAGERDALAGLAGAAADAGRAAGAWDESVQHATYRPHLTVAFNARGGGGRVSFEPYKAALGGFAGPAWRVGAMALMSSDDGHRYATVAVWPLAG
jgi:RNA 2',3'-cyclic 3'-phosphodiesterase